MADSVHDQIQRIIADPSYMRNPQRQLQSLLRIVDLAMQKQLACDFAEHLLPLYTELQPEEHTPHYAITVLQRFLTGEQVIEQICSAYVELYRLHHAWSEQSDYRLIAARECGWTMIVALWVVAQDELARIGAIWRYPKKHLAQVGDVARVAAYAVARAYGGEDWDSADRERQQQARTQGKAASDQEVRWQIRHFQRMTTISTSNAGK